jgi:hypothetical protein
MAIALDCCAVNDKQILITGATNGIGLARPENEFGGGPGPLDGARTPASLPSFAKRPVLLPGLAH